MKKSLLTVLFLLLSQTAFSIEYGELNIPLPPSERLGVGAEIENSVNVVSEEETHESIAQKRFQKDISAYDLTYADLSLKRIASDIASEVDEEQVGVVEDLSVLWAAAAQNSETIQYTIYKLSNPDENKPDDNLLKRIIKPVASFSSLAGTAFSANPFMASGAMIGGNLLGALSSDNKEINYQFTKVSDAQMVVLVRKIDDLQKKLLILYVDYKTKQKTYEMALDNLNKREKIFKSMQNKSKEQIIISDVYYRNAQNLVSKTKNEYWASRTILEQLVGVEAIKKIEENAKVSI